MTTLIHLRRGVTVYTCDFFCESSVEVPTGAADRPALTGWRGDSRNGKVACPDCLEKLEAGLPILAEIESRNMDDS